MRATLERARRIFREWKGRSGKETKEMQDIVKKKKKDGNIYKKKKVRNKGKMEMTRKKRK